MGGKETDREPCPRGGAFWARVCRELQISKQSRGHGAMELLLLDLPNLSPGQSPLPIPSVNGREGAEVGVLCSRVAGCVDFENHRRDKQELVWGRGSEEGAGR